jgi:hypothetical protein
MTFLEVDPVMNFDWLSWSNPVAIWWSFLIGVSSANIALWLILHRRLRGKAIAPSRRILGLELMVLLCAAYVFGCAFRSLLPRADVQRICLFDTWLSSIVVGRSVATIAEICFAMQWAIVLRQLGKLTQSDTVQRIACLVVPFIVTAEICSWYAVITTSFLGNAIENSIWAVTFLLIAAALVRLMADFHGAMRWVIGATVAGIACYLAFLVTIDVPMYFARWQVDQANGKPLLDLISGLHDVSTRWIVTHDVAHWQQEFAWMALYFSAAVWSSLLLCGFGLMQHRLHHYRRRPLLRLTGRPATFRVSLRREA